MATNLDRALDQIRGLIEDDTQTNLDETRNRQTGDLFRSINTFIEDEDDFVTEFLFYGQFLDEGTRFIEARPFYSNVLDDNRDEFTRILEDAFEADLNELNEELDEQIN